MTKPVDFKDLIARAKALWRSFKAVWRSLLLRVGAYKRLEQLKALLRRGAVRIPYPPVRDRLLGWLGPKELPAGDTLEGLEGPLQISDEHTKPSVDEPRPQAQVVRPSLPRRKGEGTFTAAPPLAAQKSNLIGGGGKQLGEDEVRALHHDAQRRKAEVHAVAVITKHRAKLGKFKLEKLAMLPRTFAPEPLKLFRAQFPDVSTETLQLLVPLIVPLSRDLCDRAAIHAEWPDHAREAFLAALKPDVKEKLKASVEALLAMPGPARQALLRLPRAPLATNVEALVQQWKALKPEEIRSVALALAQFTGPELQKALHEAAKPVKIAPQGIRG